MFYIARMGIFDLFCSCDLDFDLDLDPMTFIYELYPYSFEIYRMCKYELRTSRLSKVIGWHTYLHTYIHTVIWNRWTLPSPFSYEIVQEIIAECQHHFGFFLLSKLIEWKRNKFVNNCSNKSLI